MRINNSYNYREWNDFVNNLILLINYFDIEKEMIILPLTTLRSRCQNS